MDNELPSPAVADSINAAGGIHSRPVKLIECNDQYNANDTTACARKAVADPNALAVIGVAGTCGSQIYQVLAAAHMASFGDSMACPESFTSPAVFAFDSISLVPAAAGIIGIQQLHNKNVVALSIDVPEGAQYPPEVEKLVAPLGGHVTGVLIPFGAADLSPYAAKIVASKGFLLEGTDAATAIRLYKALQLQGFNQPILFNPTTWNASNIKADLGNPTNAYIETPYPLNSPGWETYIADLKKYDPSNINYGENGIDQWLAAHLIAQMANKMAAPSASQIYTQLSQTTSLDTMGLTLPIDYTKSGSVLGGAVTRPISPCVGLYKYENGQLTSVGPFLNVLPSAGTNVDCSPLGT